MRVALALLLIVVVGGALALFLVGDTRTTEDVAGPALARPGGSGASGSSGAAGERASQPARPTSGREAPRADEGTGRRELDATLQGASETRRPPAKLAARVFGRLVDDAGAVAGARVVFFGSGQDPVETKSDPRGSFSLALPTDQKPGVLSILAREHALLELGIGRLGAGETRALGELRLTPSVAIEGRVQAEDGRPIAGARLAVVSSRNAIRNMPRLLTTMSDEDGSFRIDGAPRGPLQVEARATGYGARAERLEAPQADVVVVLAPEWRFEVEVRDLDGAPIQGAEVRLEPGFEDALAATLETDAEGLARFAELGTQRWTLIVSEERHRPYSEQNVEVGGRKRVELGAWPTIRGRVVAPGGLAPPRGTRVYAMHRTRVTGRMPPSGEGAAPDADGSFAVGPVFPGGYEVIVDAPGYARTRSAELNVPLEGTVEAGTIVLQTGGALVLQVDLPANLLGGTQLTLYSDEPHPGSKWNAAEESPFQVARANADPSGPTRFEELEPGATWVIVRSPEHLPLVSGPYSVAAGSELAPLPLRPERGGHLAGLVRLGGGEPAADVLLLVRGSRVDSVVRCRTDLEGRFRSPALPTGSYRIWARVARPGAAPLAAETDATVTAGSTSEITIDL